MRFLRAEIKKLEQKIDMDEKMKKMGDMQLSAVTDNKKRKTILEQVSCRVQSASLIRIYCSTDQVQNMDRIQGDIYKYLHHLVPHSKEAVCMLSS